MGMKKNVIINFSLSKETMLDIVIQRLRSDDSACKYAWEYCALRLDGLGIEAIENAGELFEAFPEEAWPFLVAGITDRIRFCYDRCEISVTEEYVDGESWFDFSVSWFLDVDEIKDRALNLLQKQKGGDSSDRH